MSYLAVTKFHEHQHYKNRKPPWIKFKVSLLDVKHPLNQLPVSTRYLFDRMLLLAAEYDNAIPNDSELLARLLCMPHEDCREGLDQLLKGRWIKATSTKRRASKGASNTASNIAPPELEKEKERTRGNWNTSEPVRRKHQCPRCSVSCITTDDLEAHLENVHGVAA